MDSILGFIFIVCMTVVKSQNYDAYRKGLTAFPTDIPDNATSINVVINSISNFTADALSTFYQLRILNIGQNDFTEMPDLRAVGGTLTKLLATYCKVITIDPQMFNELRVLEHADFSRCLLTSFPNVPGPGNTLLYLSIGDCQMTEFPALGNYTKLLDVTLSRNPINNMQDNVLEGLYQLDELALVRTNLTSLLDNPKAMQHVGFITTFNSVRINVHFIFVFVSMFLTYLDIQNC